MIIRLLGCFLLPLFLLSSVVPAWGAPYRRFIEAESMLVEGNGYRVVQDKDSSGAAAVEVLRTDTAQLAAGGRIFKNLEEGLPVREYTCWLQVRVPAGRPAGAAPVRLEVRLGDVAGTLELDLGRPDPGGRIRLKPAAPAREISIRPSGPAPAFRIDRIYLSGEARDVRFNPVTGSHEVDYDYILNSSTDPVPEAQFGFVRFSDPAAAQPANWLANGDFEAGLGTTQWSTYYQQSYALKPEFWDRQTAYEGAASLRLTLFPVGWRTRGDRPDLPTGFQMMSRTLKLPTGRSYYFRGMARSDVPSTLLLTAETAYNPTGLARTSVQVDTGWQPFEMEIKNLQDPRGCILYLAASAAGPARLWLDALTLTDTRTEAFRPAAPVEAGVHWSAPGRVFYLEEPVNFTLLARNYAAGPAAVNLRYRVIDYFDRLVLEERTGNWPVAAGRTGERPVDLNRGRTGAFRLLVDGEAATPAGRVPIPLQEYTFSVLRRPPERMAGTFGAYITVAPEPIEIAGRAGIRRTVTLSSSNELLQTWSAIEPEPGKFVWADARVKHALANGVIITANIDIGHNAAGIPKWARDPVDPADVISCTGNRMPKDKPFTFSKQAWERFIEAVVGHYRDTIQEWLIVDEPYHYQKPEEYAVLMKTAYQAAKRANPKCRVIAHGGYYAHWLPSVEKVGAVGYFDGIHDYARNPEQGQRLREFAQKHGKFVRNVEYLWQVSLYQTIETPKLNMIRSVPWYPEVVDQVTEAVKSMAWAGGEGFSLYDGRFPGGDFTQLDAYKCLFEYDGSLKPSGVVLAVMANLLDGFRGMGQPVINPVLDTFELEGPARFAFAVCGADRRVLEGFVRLPEGVRAYDFMGNQLDPAAPLLFPNYGLLYLVGPRERLEATRAALAAAVLQPPVDLKMEQLLDEKSGQYRVRVTVTNRRPDRPLTGKILFDAPQLRDFWSKVQPVALGPGESRNIYFGLNYYRGDRFDPPETRLNLYFDGVRADQALSGFTETHSLRLRKADALLKEKQFAEAEAIYRELLPVMSAGQVSETGLKIAQALQGQEKGEAALTEFQKVAEGAGGRPQDRAAAWLALAENHEGRQEIDAAAAAYRKAGELEGGPAGTAATAWYQMARMLRARNQASSRDAETALEAYRKSAAIPEAWANIGGCAQLYLAHFLRDLKRYPEARVEYRKLLDKPGALAMYVKQAREALEALEKSLAAPAAR